MARRPTSSELLVSERVLGDFFHRSTVGLAVIDPQFRYRAVNSCLAASNRLAPELHIGKHLREILGTATAQQAESAIEQVLASAKPIINQTIAGPLPSRPEGARWLDSFFPMLDSTGKVEQIGVVVVELDPTAQIEHMEDVRSAQMVLRSWKDIARYVGACVKTVQRWEHQQGFPVRRVTPGKGAVVFALRDEVDQWLESLGVSRKAVPAEMRCPQKW